MMLNLTEWIEDKYEANETCIFGALSSLESYLENLCELYFGLKDICINNKSI